MPRLADCFRHWGLTKVRRGLYVLIIWFIILWTVVCGGWAAWTLATFDQRVASLTNVSDSVKHYALIGSLAFDAMAWAAILVPIGIIALLLRPTPGIRVERNKRL